MEYKIVLSIAGSDSSAGAGIQADMKSVAACGGYCATAITALTAQNTCGVWSVNIVSDEVVKAQIDAVLEDLDVAAVKLGMLPSSGIVMSVRDAIVCHGIKNVVLDPVMIATSGDMLVSECVAREIITKLLPLATVITPNVMECEFISGLTIHGEEDFARAADFFRKLGTKAVLLKSGHLKGVKIRDYLYNFVDNEVHIFEYDKLDTQNTHGTGCSLSSAIASYLVQGYPISEAVRRAENYIHSAIAGADYVIGHGHGPIHHFYNLRVNE
ncbi:MAG: bifunctional hydroxymethylpyrimidine kinase/phosphomethylpyrimidine kinase [Rikenellaceae bacterium]